MNLKPFRFWKGKILSLSLILSLALPVAASEFLVIDAGKDRVLRYEGSTGVFLSELISPASGGLTAAQGITIGPDSNLYVSSGATGSIKRYDRTTGAYLGDFVTSGSGGLSNPDQVIFGRDGNLYVSDRFSGRVLRYDGLTGASLGTFVDDARLGGFVAFTFGPDNRLYASMFNGSPQCILRFDGTTGTFVDEFACAPDSSSAFSGLAFGSDGRLYASRYHLGEVWQLDGSSGTLLRTLHCPGDARADYLGFGPDGRLYVSTLSANDTSRFDVQTGQCLGPYPMVGEINQYGKGFVFSSTCGGPAISDVSVSPNALWPPNHTMVPVMVSYTVNDNCDPTPVCSLSVRDNEAGNGGSGNTSPDWMVLDAHNVDLRAERAGTGAGRVYTVAISCQDKLALSSNATATVTVVHDQDKKH